MLPRTDGELRSPNGPPGSDSVCIRMPPPLLPSDSPGLLHPSAAPASTPRLEAGETRPSAFGERKGPETVGSSPSYRVLAPKPGPSYLRRRHGTLSTESLEPAHAPPGSPRTIASAQAQNGLGVLLPMLLCGLGARRRVVPEGVRRREAGRGGAPCGVVS